MANDLNLPSLTELVNRIQTDIQTELPQSNPFLPESALLAFVISLAARFDENYNQLQSLFNDLYLNTASDQFVERWGSIWGIARLAATPSAGNVVATGTVSSNVPQGTILNATDDISYETQADIDIETDSKTVTLSISGVVVTVTDTDTDDFAFATGQTVTIAGADVSDYNGDFTITMVDSLTFNYTLSATPSGDPTGTITAASDMAVMDVLSTTGGQNTNQTSGTNLTFSNTIAGVDSISFVDLGGLEGGLDEESDDDYRARVLTRIREPVAQWSISSIKALAFEIQGVTRVFVFSITPDIGAVTVFFVRDNDGTGLAILPNSEEIALVRANLLTIIPPDMNSDLLFVDAPTPITVIFNFQSITPSSITMQEAIKANLQQYFTENAGVGDDILELAYNSVIFNTIDPNTGQQISAFSLVSPVGNVGITDDQIGILGNVTF